MAINVISTKSGASMKLIKDADSTVNSSISGLVAVPDRNKLWTVAKALNKLQIYEMSKLLLSETVEIDEA